MDVMGLIDAYLALEGKTQHGLAEAAGCSPRYLSEALSGKHRLSAAVAAAVAAELQAAELIEPGEIALMRFELGCRNVDLRTVRGRAAA